MVVTDGKMTETSWKPFYGNCVQEHLGEIFHVNFVLGKQLITVLTVGPQKVYGRIFF